MASETGLAGSARRQAAALVEREPGRHGSLGLVEKAIELMWHCISRFGTVSNLLAILAC